MTAATVDAGSAVGAAELRRLQAQVALSWDDEWEMLVAAGLRDGMHVVDLGCGPGLVTASLLERFPGMRVTAVERDPAMRELAAERLADYGSRVRVRDACASATALPDADADFVIARYLFQHLSDPGAVAREALRILRPGGVAAVIDVDVQLLGIVTPVMPVVQSIFERGRRHQADGGGRPFIGRHLWRTLRDAGFAAPRLRAFVYHSDELGKDAFEPLLSADQLLAAHAAGRVSDPELAIAAAAVRRFLADPDAFVLMLGFMATGRKGESS